jgi:hypothetical protein
VAGRNGLEDLQVREQKDCLRRRCAWVSGLPQWTQATGRPER